MRVTTDWRRAGPAFALVALIALAGCDGRKAGGTAAGPDGATIEPDGGGPPARQQAEAFLRDLGEGKVGPERLTTAFRKEIPPPAVGGVPRAEATEAEIREWLEQFRDTRFPLLQETQLANGAVVFRGRAEMGNRKDAFTLRLVKDGGAYKCDWLHRSTHIEPGIKPPPNGDLTAAQDTVRNFLDILLGGDHRQAHTLMDPAWKERIAPPYESHKKAGLGYNPGFLTGYTKFLRRDYTGYTLPNAELGPNKATATFVAEFQAGGKTVPYVVKAATDPGTGRWMIQDFQSPKS